MPTTALTFDNQFLTTTLYAIVKEMKSQIDRPVRLIEKMEKYGMEEEDGGERIIIPLNFDRHSSTTQLTTGYEPINLSVQPIGTPAYAQWGDWIRPIVISGHEERINRGSYKVLDILETRAKDTYNALRMDLQQQLLRDNVATLSDCNTLNGEVDATGFIENAALAAQNNVVLNVSKATFNSVGWTNQIFNGGGAFSTNGLVGLQDLEIRIDELAPESRGRRCMYGSLAGCGHLKRALRTQERYATARDEDELAGRQVQVFGDMQVIPCRDMPDAAINGAGQEWTFLIVDHGAVKFRAQRGYWFKTGEFQQQSGYDLRASFLHLMGQLTTDYLGSSGVLYNGDTW